MITTEHIRHSGGLIVTALVKDRNPAGNLWGSPFLHARTYYGYTRREAIEAYRDSLIRDGLTIARDA